MNRMIQALTQVAETTSFDESDLVAESGGFDDGAALGEGEEKRDAAPPEGEEKRDAAPSDDNQL